ncbi:MAG: hypothetical protein ACE5J9_04390 [Methanosarcinales archaeon]
MDYVTRGEGDEKGIVKLAMDAAINGYNKMDDIMRRHDIPNDLAFAFKLIYQERIAKMEKTATEYLKKHSLLKNPKIPE